MQNKCLLRCSSLYLLLIRLQHTITMSCQVKEMRKVKCGDMSLLAQNTAFRSACFDFGKKRCSFISCLISPLQISKFSIITLNKCSEECSREAGY